MSRSKVYRSLARWATVLIQWVHDLNRVKAVAMVTVSCFMVSTVFGQVGAAIADTGREAARLEQLVTDLNIPVTAGRITEGRYCGGNQVVINIQDLHCNPEVQKNISQILSALDERLGLKRVYLEGTSGDAVNTSWLTDIKDKKMQREVVDSLMEEGKLTGAEYYSVSSGKPDLIYGLEDKAAYDQNVVRLNKILENRQQVTGMVDEMHREMLSLKKSYYNGKQHRFDTLTASYKGNALEPGKYYSLLKHFSDRYGIDIQQYENVARYIALMDLEKKLNYKRISRELQEFVGILKQRLPYAAYGELVKRTDNLSRIDKMYPYLTALAKENNIDVASRLPHLAVFFQYLTLNQGINPVRLIYEEKKLGHEIFSLLSNNQSERETVFLDYMLGYLDDYVNNKATAEDYVYFQGHLPAFKLLWAKYTNDDAFARLDPSLRLLNDYYRVNVERNGHFLDVINAHGQTPKAVAANGDVNELLANLGKAKEVIVTVTGGFHSNGLAEIFKQNNVSYLIITPNVKGQLEFSQNVYTSLIREQAKLATQTLAVLPLSAKNPIIHVRSALTACIRHRIDQAVKNNTPVETVAGQINDELNKLLADWADKKHLGEGVQSIAFNLAGITDSANYSFTLRIVRNDGTVDVREFAVENGNLRYVSENGVTVENAVPVPSVRRATDRLREFFILSALNGGWFRAGFKRIFGPAPADTRSQVSREIFKINHPVLGRLGLAGILARPLPQQYNVEILTKEKFKVFRLTDLHSHSSVDIVPGAGGKVSSFIVEGLERLYSPAIAESGGNHVMYPFAGRIYSNRILIDGKEVEFKEKDIPGLVARGLLKQDKNGVLYHGMVRNLPWSVDKIGFYIWGISLTCSLDHGKFPDIKKYFGRGRISITYCLEGNTLSKDISVTGTKLFSLVDHPWFLRTPGKWYIRSNARKHFVAEAGTLKPTGEVEEVSGKYDLRQFTELTDQNFNDVFTDAVYDDKGQAVVYLYNETDGTLIEYKFDKNLPFPVICTENNNAIMVEGQSSANNVFELDHAVSRPVARRKFLGLFYVPWQKVFSAHTEIRASVIKDGSAGLPVARVGKLVDGWASRVKFDALGKRKFSEQGRSCLLAHENEVKDAAEIERLTANFKSYFSGHAILRVRVAELEAAGIQIKYSEKFEALCVRDGSTIYLDRNLVDKPVYEEPWNSYIDRNKHVSTPAEEAHKAVAVILQGMLNHQSMHDAQFGDPADEFIEEVAAITRELEIYVKAMEDAEENHRSDRDIADNVKVFIRDTVGIEDLDSVVIDELLDLAREISKHRNSWYVHYGTNDCSFNREAVNKIEEFVLKYYGEHSSTIPPADVYEKACRRINRLNSPRLLQQEFEKHVFGYSTNSALYGYTASVQFDRTMPLLQDSSMPSGTVRIDSQKKTVTLVLPEIFINAALMTSPAQCERLIKGYVLYVTKRTLAMSVPESDEYKEFAKFAQQNNLPMNEENYHWSVMRGRNADTKWYFEIIRTVGALRRDIVSVKTLEKMVETFVSMANGEWDRREEVDGIAMVSGSVSGNAVKAMYDSVFSQWSMLVPMHTAFGISKDDWDRIASKAFVDILANCIAISKADDHGAIFCVSIDENGLRDISSLPSKFDHIYQHSENNLTRNVDATEQMDSFPPDVFRGTVSGAINSSMGYINIQLPFKDEEYEKKRAYVQGRLHKGLITVQEVESQLDTLLVGDITQILSLLATRINRGKTLSLDILIRDAFAHRGIQLPANLTLGSFMDLVQKAGESGATPDLRTQKTKSPDEKDFKEIFESNHVRRIISAAGLHTVVVPSLVERLKKAQSIVSVVDDKGRKYVINGEQKASENNLRKFCSFSRIIIDVRGPDALIVAQNLEEALKDYSPLDSKSGMSSKDFTAISPQSVSSEDKLEAGGMVYNRLMAHLGKYLETNPNLKSLYDVLHEQGVEIAFAEDFGSLGRREGNVFYIEKKLLESVGKRAPPEIELLLEGLFSYQILHTSTVDIDIKNEFIEESAAIMSELLPFIKAIKEQPNLSEKIKTFLEEKMGPGNLYNDVTDELLELAGKMAADPSLYASETGIKEDGAALVARFVRQNYHAFRDFQLPDDIAAQILEKRDVFILQENLETMRELHQAEMTPGGAVVPWDYVVIAAATEDQARAFESEIGYRREAGMFAPKTKVVAIGGLDNQNHGTGGAVFNVVRITLQRIAEEMKSRGEEIRSLDDIIKNKKILILLSGGSSKRIPIFSAVGKIFTPMAAKLSGKGKANATTTLFDELYTALSGAAAKMKEGIVPMPGDAQMIFDWKRVQLGKEGWNEVVWRAPAAEAVTHGVRAADANGIMQHSVEKWSVERLRGIGAVDENGLVNLSTALIMGNAEQTKYIAELAGLRVENGALIYDRDKDFTPQHGEFDWFGQYLRILAAQARQEDILADAKTDDERDIITRLWQKFREQATTLYRVLSVLPFIFADFGTTGQFQDHFNFGFKTMVNRVYRFQKRINYHIATGAYVSGKAGIYDSIILGLREYETSLKDGRKLTFSVDRSETIVKCSEPGLVGAKVDFNSNTVVLPNSGKLTIAPIESETYNAGYIGDDSILSWCQLEGDFKVGDNCIVYMVRDPLGKLRLESNTIIYQVPVKAGGGTKTVNVVYGAQIRDAQGRMIRGEDDPKKEGMKATIFGQNMHEWLKGCGLTENDMLQYIWPGVDEKKRSLWNARIYAPGDDDFSLVNWMMENAPRTTPAKWRQMMRKGELMSMDDVTNCADHAAIISRKRAIRENEFLTGPTYFDTFIRNSWKKLLYHTVDYDPQDNLSQKNAVIEIPGGKRIGIGYSRWNRIIRSTDYNTIPRGFTFDPETRTVRNKEHAVVGKAVWVDTDFRCLEETNRGGFVVRYDPRREDTTREKIPQSGEVMQAMIPGAFNLGKDKVPTAIQEKVINKKRSFRIVANKAPVLRNSILLASDEVRPQVLCRSDVLDAVSMVRNSNLRLWFNSLGAAASVNHLHIQGAYSDDLPVGLKQFPVEEAAVQDMYNIGEVKIGVFKDYPAQGVIFTGEDEAELSEAAYRYVNLLQEKNIPHNLFILRGKIIVFAKNADKLITCLGVNPAGIELAGIITVSDPKWMGNPPSAQEVRQGLAESTLSRDRVMALLSEFHDTYFKDDGKRIDDQLLRALESQSDSLIRRYISQKLEDGFGATIGFLRGVLENGDQKYHVGAVQALGLLGSEGAVALLKNTAGDSRNAVRAAVTRAFGAIKGAAAGEALINFLDDKFYGVYLEAAYLIGESRNRKATPVMARKLGEEKECTLALKEKLARALGKIGYAGENGEAVEVLIHRSHTSRGYETLRKACVWALGRLDYTNDAAKHLAEATQELFERAQNDESIAVRIEAARALGEIVKKNSADGDHIAEMLFDLLKFERDWQVREAIVGSIGTMPYAGQLEALRNIMVNEKEDLSVRVAAVKALIRKGNAVPQAIKYVGDALDAPANEIAEQADNDPWIARRLDESEVASLLRDESQKGVSVSVESARRGVYKELAEMFKAVDREHMVRDFWDRDGYWARFEDKAERLGWQRLPDAMLKEIAGIKEMVREIKAEGKTDVVVFGMGGATQGIYTYLKAFGARNGINIHILDTTSPRTVKAIENKVNLDKTLFIFSSKAGGVPEGNANFEYFWSRCAERFGKEKAGKWFVAITDPDYPLDGKARKLQFRHIFHSKVDVGGRFSALSMEMMVMAELMGVDTADLLKRVNDNLIPRLRSYAEAGKNPAVQIAVALEALRRKGIDKVTVVASRSLTEFIPWWEQLVSECSGKDGKGIVPTSGEGYDQSLADAGLYKDRVFIRIQKDGEPLHYLDMDRNIPVIDIKVPSEKSLGELFYLWEMAITLQGQLMEINPFDEPGVVGSKQRTGEYIDQLRNGTFESEQKYTALSADGSVALDYGTAMRVFGGITDDELDAVLRKIGEPRENISAVYAALVYLAKQRGKSYGTLMHYMPATEKEQGALNAARSLLHKALLTTFTGEGPRFQHSALQLFMGGDNSGFHTIISCDDDPSPLPMNDPAKPGFTFAQFIRAQSLGTKKALEDVNRLAVRFGIQDSDASAETLQQIFKSAEGYLGALQNAESGKRHIRGLKAAISAALALALMLTTSIAAFAAPLTEVPAVVAVGNHSSLMSLMIPTPLFTIAAIVAVVLQVVVVLSVLIKNRNGDNLLEVVIAAVKNTRAQKSVGRIAPALKNKTLVYVADDPAELELEKAREFADRGMDVINISGDQGSAGEEFNFTVQINNEDTLVKARYAAVYKADKGRSVITLSLRAADGTPLTGEALGRASLAVVEELNGNPPLRRHLFDKKTGEINPAFCSYNPFVDPAAVDDRYSRTEFLRKSAVVSFAGTQRMNEGRILAEILEPAVIARESRPSMIAANIGTKVAVSDFRKSASGKATFADLQANIEGFDGYPVPLMNLFSGTTLGINEEIVDLDPSDTKYTEKELAAFKKKNSWWLARCSADPAWIVQQMLLYRQLEKMISRNKNKKIFIPEINIGAVDQDALRRALFCIGKFGGVRLKMLNSDPASLKEYERFLADLRQAADRAKPEALVTVVAAATLKSAITMNGFKFMNRVRLSKGQALQIKIAGPGEWVELYVEEGDEFAIAKGEEAILQKVLRDVFIQSRGAECVLFPNIFGLLRGRVAETSDYIVPRAGESNVLEETALRNYFQGLVRTVAVELQLKEVAYDVGIRIAGKISVSAMNRRELRAYRAVSVYPTSHADMKGTQGIGLHTLLTAFELIKSKSPSEAPEYCDEYMRNTILMLSKYSLVTGKAQRQWRAALSYARDLQNAADKSDPSEQMEYASQLNQFISGIMTGILEHSFPVEKIGRYQATYRNMRLAYDSFGIAAEGNVDRDYRNAVKEYLEWAGRANGYDEEMVTLCRTLMEIIDKKPRDLTRADYAAIESAKKKTGRPLIATVLLAKALEKAGKAQGKTFAETQAEVEAVINPVLAVFGRGGSVPELRSHDRTSDKHAAWAMNGLLEMFELFNQQPKFKLDAGKMFDDIENMITGTREIGTAA